MTAEILTVAVQGLLSFFSPCVLPLIPVYMGYFAGGMKTENADGSITYEKKRVFINTLFFSLGIGAAFFLLGYGFTALGQFLGNNRIWFARAGGVLLILLGTFQLLPKHYGGREFRLPFHPENLALNPFTALLLGFTFSFAWTPCVGPALGSVLLTAGLQGNEFSSFILIGVYTLCFIIPFLITGMFLTQALAFFKKHQKIVQYTVKIGAAILIVMGVLMFAGKLGGTGAATAESNTSSQTTTQSQETAKTYPAAFDFDLVDQNGQTVKLSDYKGKTVFINFWATWCPYCLKEMPEIQELYEKYGKNTGDVIILGLASPNYGREGSESDITGYLTENGYTFPTALDPGGKTASQYNVNSYPTTYMINADGNIFGYVPGAISKDTMIDIIEKTQASTAK